MEDCPDRSAVRRLAMKPPSDAEDDAQLESTTLCVKEENQRLKTNNGCNSGTAECQRLATNSRMHWQTVEHVDCRLSYSYSGASFAKNGKVYNKPSVRTITMHRMGAYKSQPCRSRVGHTSHMLLVRVRVCLSAVRSGTNAPWTETKQQRDTGSRRQGALLSVCF